MTLLKKQNAMTKILDYSTSTVVVFSLVLSLFNPAVVEANTPPALPVTFQTSTPAVDLNTSTSAPVVVEPNLAPEKVVEQKKYVVKYTKKVVATAYSSEAAQTDSTPCIPAMWKFNLCENFAKTGIEDTIADNSLKLGTVVQFKELPGRIFVVRDRMNSKYTGKPRIDFWMNKKSDAIKFGAQKMTMEVLEEVKPVEEVAQVASNIK